MKTRFWTGFFARATLIGLTGWSIHAHAAAAPARHGLQQQVVPALGGLTAHGRLAETNVLALAIGLSTPNRPALEELVHQLYDPRTTNFHRFISPAEFAANFGPSQADYDAVVEFAQTNGLQVFGTHSNRLVLDVEGSPANIERAFGITLRSYRHPREPRDFFAPDAEPSVPGHLAVVAVEGLSDFQLPQPMSHQAQSLGTRPLGGTGPSGYYAGRDFRNAYVPGTALTGTGQAVGLLQFSAYFAVDITNYQNTIGMTNRVPLNNVVIGRAPTTANNVEVALDIEMAIAMAPGLSRVIVYEIRSGPSSILSRMANDNLAKQLSSSWTWTGGPTATIDTIFLQMASQGQSYFQASGDSDAYTGTQILDNSGQTTAPVDSTNITSVGGTSLSMNGSGASWASESVWNYHAFGGSSANVGSGGGVSIYYKLPYWQTNVSLANNGGSTTWRNVPDVALTADSVYVAYNNGSSGGLAGTSCAAPLWAGFCALINQQAMATSGTTVGFLNPALYALANSPDYTNCFHDITVGDNIGTNTAGLFHATEGYDLCTGLGTPNGMNLINALAPPTQIYFLTQPANQSVTSGANFSLGGTVNGQKPISYFWLYNGVQIPDGGSLTGTTSNVLTFTAVTTNDAGAYQLVASNSFGALTSSVAVVSVGFAPAFTALPTNQTLLAGGNAIFSAAVSGSTPITYQWRKNSTNLVNGAGISGATSDTLTLGGITTNSAGAYSLLASNQFGTATRAANLTVVLPPMLTSALTNRTIECGGNVTFSGAATGTAPLSYQWSVDGNPVAGATTASLTLSNVHLPDHNVSLAVTNAYAGLVSNAVLTVQDTAGPVLVRNGANPIWVELGDGFSDPGATANDACAGPVPVTVTGNVILGSIGTNTLFYSAADGNGNSNTISRTVIVRDTTPPAIAWSLTNSALAVTTDCTGPAPDLTGTNFLEVSDASGNWNVTQSPPAATPLAVGTNLVVVTATDASGNASSVTNFVAVLDLSPPLLLFSAEDRTNFAGTTVTLNAPASGCSALDYQWLFNGGIVPGATNSSLARSAVTPAANGEYAVMVHSAGGSATGVVARLTVNLVPTSLTLTSARNPAGYLAALSFLASISAPGAVGEVQFATNGTVFDIEPVLGGQSTSLNLSGLPRGTNLITATYLGDPYDLGSSDALEQVVTNHPPVAPPVHFTYAAEPPFVLAITDLATNWSDADGDPVTLIAVSVSTNGVAVTNEGGTLIYFNPEEVADEFTVTISDGWGGTSYQTITMLPPATVAPNIVGGSGNADGSFALELAGASGRTYVLEAASEVETVPNWLPVATNTLDASGVWHFNDTQAASFPQRFYRLRQGP